MEKAIHLRWQLSLIVIGLSAMTLESHIVEIVSWSAILVFPSPARSTVTSSCEAEYRATFSATVECVWLRRLLTDLLFEQPSPTSKCLGHCTYKTYWSALPFCLWISGMTSCHFWSIVILKKMWLIYLLSHFQGIQLICSSIDSILYQCFGVERWCWRVAAPYLHSLSTIKHLTHPQLRINKLFYPHFYRISYFPLLLV